MNAIHYSSKSPEHLTPARILTAVVEVLGQIDLDPCSDAGHNIPAVRHYTVADNGLALPWTGRVYLNPPYGREIGLWVSRLVTGYEARQVSEAIALLPARPDTAWWRRLPCYAYVCFVHGRLKFAGPGNGHAAPFPSAVVYLGPRLARFSITFARFGSIWKIVRPECPRGEISS